MIIGSFHFLPFWWLFFLASRSLYYRATTRPMSNLLCPKKHPDSRKIGVVSDFRYLGFPHAYGWDEKRHVWLTILLMQPVNKVWSLDLLPPNSAAAVKQLSGHFFEFLKTLSCWESKLELNCLFRMSKIPHFNHTTSVYHLLTLDSRFGSWLRMFLK